MSRDAEQEEEGEGIHVGGSDDVRGGVGGDQPGLVPHQGGFGTRHDICQ